MFTSTRRRVIVVLVVIAIATASVQLALALAGGQGGPVAGGYSNDGSLGGAELVRVQRRANPAVTSSTTYSTLGTLQIPVAPFGQHFLVMRFSGESACYATTPNEINPQWCRVRITVDGVAAFPQEGAVHTAGFDSTDGGTVFGAPHDDVSEGPSSYESHAIERTICIQSNQELETNATVKVQWATTIPNVEFWLDDWSLSVERWNRCQSAQG